MKTLLFIVLDGAADTPNKELDGKTPYEVAETPNLDFLARNGKNGIVEILPIPPESDEAVIALLGYNVFEVFTGRGPLEAIGGGLNMKDGDLALRCNFATIEDKKIVNVRAGGIKTEDSEKLERAINRYVSLKDAEFEFKATEGFRGALVIRSNKKLSGRISNTHPGYDLRILDIFWERDGKIKYVPLSEAVREPLMEIKECEPIVKTKSAIRSANLVNEFIEKSRYVLKTHKVNRERVENEKPPANIILTRNAGNRVPKLYNLNKAHKLKWACFVDMPVERGIAHLAGMDVIPIPSPTKDIENDMKIRVLTLLKNIHHYNAFYVHIKGPDPFGHLGDLKGKIKCLEDIDKYFFKPLLKDIDLENTIIVVTSDHTTSTEFKVHTEDPVPVIVFGTGKPDNVARISEKESKKGRLGKIHSRNLMSYVVNKLKKFD